VSEIAVVENRGITYVNTTPHEIRLVWPDGEEFVVPPSGVVINAKVREQVRTRAMWHQNSNQHNRITFVRTKFTKEKESLEKLAEIEKQYPGAIVIGSIIAAQAYPGRIVAMTPAPGFERVPPAEKRMRADKFTVY
jgi:hypothetical protein